MHAPAAGRACHTNGLDPLTHTLTGLYLSRAGLNRWTPHSAVLLMLAANAPDIDVITLAGGPAAALHWHRHFTHSFAFSPILALAVVALVRVAGRQPLRWLPAWFAAWLAVCSHILLDLTNVYGTHAALPFSGAWLHWDVTNVFDVWIWALLLTALAAPWLGRLVGSEISSGAVRATRHFGQGWAVAALALLLLYDGGRAVLHSRVLNMLEARVYGGVEPRLVAAYPDAFSPLAWRGTVQTDDAFYFYPIQLAAAFDPLSAAPVHPADASAILPALHANPAFHEFLDFNQAPLWQSAPSSIEEHATIMRLTDLRFGWPGQSAFACEALLTPQQRVTKTACSFGSGGHLQ